MTNVVIVNNSSDDSNVVVFRRMPDGKKQIISFLGRNNSTGHGFDPDEAIFFKSTNLSLNEYLKNNIDECSNLIE